MISALLAGLGLGLSLIVAIGAQNLFVLRQGVRREHVMLVATVCAVSDAILIVLGVSGIGLVLQSAPVLIDVVRVAGAAFLIGYGLLAAKRAWRPSGSVLTSPDDASEPDADGVAGGGPRTATAIVATRRRIVLTCLALTWLNPHVYLDTVFLVGSVAASHGDGTWSFALGAVTASVLWFFGLAYGARHLGRLLGTPRAWRILDAVIALVMIALGIGLLV